MISQEVNGIISYYGYDGLGSTKFLTNQNGLISDTYQYNAYGEVTSKTGNTDNNYLYAGEQFDRSLNQYYLRARYYNQGVGRFTQMDTWQGRANSPITLNKYEDARPTYYTDPSGYMSLGGLLQGLSIQNNLNRISLSANVARRVKTYKIHLGSKSFKKMIEQRVPHAFIYAENKFTRHGYRYDVGARIQQSEFINLVKNPFLEVDGVITKSGASKSSIRKDRDVISPSIVTLTKLQYVLWDAVVLNQGTPDRECSVNAKYSISGLNCVSWTLKASAEAMAISKLPL